MGEFTRQFYIVHPVDDTRQFEQTMNEILCYDDVNKFHDYVKGFSDNYHYPALLDMCLERMATKCALHMIQGKLPHGPPILSTDHLEPMPRHPVLYHVIHLMCEPDVFRLLLDDCRALHQVNQPYFDLLPLEWLLSLLEDIPPLSDWSPGKPLSMLIDSLFASQVRPKLECAQMLAQNTHLLDEIALGFIHNEEIVALAALLLVAPVTPGDFKRIKSYTSIESIASQAIHGQSFTPATLCAAVLLDIFEKNGDKLTYKFNNPQEESTEAGKRDQSFVNLLIPQLQKRVVNVSKEGQSISNNIIEQIGTTSFLRRLSSDANLSSNHYLSLHSVLGSLVTYDYLSKWSPGQSVVKLILLLFLQRELKPTLECAQLAAKCTDSVNEVAFSLIKQGGLIQLAGLLLVAREKAMEPLESGETVKEATRTEIVSQVFHGESVTATIGAAGLFEIFEVAGDALAEYWSIYDDEHEPKRVIYEVAKRIQHSGIQVESTDVDLTDIYSASSHPGMLQTICERLGIEIGKTSGLSQNSGQFLYPSAKRIKESCKPVPTWIEPWDYTTESESEEDMTATKSSETPLRVPRLQAFDKVGTRAFSTSCCIVDRVSRGGLKHSLASPSPSPSPIVRNLAYLVTKLKRGVRLV